MIAIHKEEGTFSDYWISYCETKNIPYKTISAYDSDIIEQVSDCHSFLWHIKHDNSRDKIIAHSLFSSLEALNIKTFPSTKDVLFFDNKISQKYLFEAHSIKTPKTILYFNEEDALSNVSALSFPIVGKLKTGAGGLNVFLLQNEDEYKKYVRKSFKKGIRDASLKSRFRRHRNLKMASRRSSRIKITLKYILQQLNNRNRETGYVLFQQFIQTDGFDVRVVVINDRAYTAKRLCNPGDFRASGSEKAVYENENENTAYISAAFNVADILKTNCIAIDFVQDKNTQEVFVVEVSPLFSPNSMNPCTGFWNRDLEWEYNDQHVMFGLMESVTRDMS